MNINQSNQKKTQNLLFTKSEPVLVITNLMNLKVRKRSNTIDIFKSTTCLDSSDDALEKLETV